MGLGEFEAPLNALENFLSFECKIMLTVRSELADEGALVPGALLRSGDPLFGCPHFLFGHFGRPHVILGRTGGDLCKIKTRLSNIRVKSLLLYSDPEFIKNFLLDRYLCICVLVRNGTGLVDVQFSQRTRFDSSRV